MAFTSNSIMGYIDSIALNLFYRYRDMLLVITAQLQNILSVSQHPVLEHALFQAFFYGHALLERSVTGFQNHLFAIRYTKDVSVLGGNEKFIPCNGRVVHMDHLCIDRLVREMVAEKDIPQDKSLGLCFFGHGIKDNKTRLSRPGAEPALPRFIRHEHLLCVQVRGQFLLVITETAAKLVKKRP